GVRLLPVVGDVLVHDDVVAGVGYAVSAGRLEVHGDVGHGRLVVLMRLELRVELVPRGREVGDADDLARLAGGVVALAPVDRGAVPFEQQLVREQAATLIGRDARVGRRDLRRGEAAGRRHGAGVLVVERRAGIRGEPGEALLVDDPAAERAALRRRVLV